MISVINTAKLAVLCISIIACLVSCTVAPSRLQPPVTFSEDQNISKLAEKKSDPVLSIQQQSNVAIKNTDTKESVLKSEMKLKKTIFLKGKIENKKANDLSVNSVKAKAKVTKSKVVFVNKKNIVSKPIIESKTSAVKRTIKSEDKLVPDELHSEESSLAGDSVNSINTIKRKPDKKITVVLVEEPFINPSISTNKAVIDSESPYKNNFKDEVEKTSSNIVGTVDALTAEFSDSDKSKFFESGNKIEPAVSSSKSFPLISIEINTSKTDREVGEDKGIDESKDIDKNMIDVDINKKIYPLGENHKSEVFSEDSIESMTVEIDATDNVFDKEISNQKKSVNEKFLIDKKDSSNKKNKTLAIDISIPDIEYEKSNDVGKEVKAYVLITEGEKVNKIVVKKIKYELLVSELDKILSIDWTGVIPNLSQYNDNRFSYCRNILKEMKDKKYKALPPYAVDVKDYNQWRQKLGNISFVQLAEYPLNFYQITDGDEKINAVSTIFKTDSELSELLPGLKNTIAHFSGFLAFKENNQRGLGGAGRFYSKDRIDNTSPYLVQWRESYYVLRPQKYNARHGIVNRNAYRSTYKSIEIIPLLAKQQRTQRNCRWVNAKS